MSNRQLIIVILGFLYITSFPFSLYCSNTGNDKAKTVQKVKDKSIPENYIVHIEPELQKILRNPLSGWVVYSSANADQNFWVNYDNLTVPALGKKVKVSDYAHTMYMRVSWTILNPEENVYGWDTNGKLKSMIENARKRGMRLAFRVVVDSRDKFSNFTPSFVKEAGADGYETQTEGKTVWSPYSDDPVFQEKYEKFIKAFAAKFNDSDLVDFIDGYGLGKWGEAHAVIYKDSTNREKVFKWVVDLYSNNFTKVPLAINYHRLVGVGQSWGAPDHDSERLLDYAVGKGYILRQDAFGMTDYYQQWEKDYAAKWRYKRPVIMEGGWVTLNHHAYWKDPRGYKSIADVRQGEFDDSKEAHVNMMDLRFRETESWFEDKFSLIKGFIEEGGYRLYPDEISLPASFHKGSKIKIKHRWNNLGWGYCPNNLPQWNFKYKVAFALLDLQTHEPRYIFVDKDSDPSKWIKNNPVNYVFSPSTVDVLSGQYLWGITIVDTSKNNEKGLDISVKGDVTTKGWLPLFNVEIK